MTEQWGPFAAGEMDRSALRGLQMTTLYGIEALKRPGEAEDGFFDAFDNALEELYEPRHPAGTCINLAGRDDTPLIEYVARDEEERGLLEDGYRQAAAVATTYRDEGVDAVPEDERREAIEAAEQCYELLQEREDYIADPLGF